MEDLGVVIQAGGEGRRLWGVTGGDAKALALINGRPLVRYQLEQAARLRPSRIVVLACHQARTVREVVGSEAEVIAEDEPLGSAGGLALLPAAPQRWLSINVDHVSDVDFSALVDRDDASCRAVVHRKSLRIDEGVVDIQNGQILEWRERPEVCVTVTTGAYIFQRNALTEALDGSACSMPELITRLMPSGVYAFMHEGMWYDVGTPARLREAEAWLKRERS